MARWLYPFTVLGLVLWAYPAAANAPTPEEIIASSLTRCEARLQAHLAQADSARRTANALLIIGAVVAALGNALAPFLKKASHRKTMAVLGALGAVLAVVPKTLDDPATFKALHDNAERHRDVAVKVQRQIGFVSESEAKSALTKYVIARLADCESGSPSPQPPDLPKLEGEEVAICIQNDAMADDVSLAPGTRYRFRPIADGESFPLSEDKPQVIFEFDRGLPVTDAATRDHDVPQGTPVSMHQIRRCISLDDLWESLGDQDRQNKGP